MVLFNKVAIVGVGLIGGSIGAGLKKKRLARRVIGIGHSQKSLDTAIDRKLIDEAYPELKEAALADLVILSTPVKTIIELLPELSKLISPGTIVIDVGSTKTGIIKAAQKYKLNFIGCHPLAGRERRGPENAQSDMFKDSLCLIVPPAGAGKKQIKRVCDLWVKLGAKVRILDATAHDRILAFVSHLPHAVAFSLIDCIESGYWEFASGGLRDTTRIGLSDPLMWRDIFLTNRKELLSAIKRFNKSLANLKRLISVADPKKIEAHLSRMQEKRRVLMK